MSIGCCFMAGLRRVLRSPALIFWIFATSLLLTLPLTVAMRNAIKQSVGTSLVQQNLRQGLDMDWLGEFLSQGDGIRGTFGPRVVGFLPVLINLDKLLDGRIFSAELGISIAGMLFLLVWAFFGGGILSRYARPEKLYTRSTFFADSGEYFLRFVRLVILSILVYLALYQWVAAPLFRLIDRLTRDTPAEIPEMVYSGLVFLLLAFLLMILSMAMDYAKIAMVVENRRSSILAFLRGLRFVFSNKLKSLGLYLLLILVGVILFGIYGLLAPGPNQANDFTLIVAFIGGQVFLIARLILKLWFLAGQTMLFQSVTGPEAITAMGTPAAASLFLS